MCRAGLSLFLPPIEIACQSNVFIDIRVKRVDSPPRTVFLDMLSSQSRICMMLFLRPKTGNVECIFQHYNVTYGYYLARARISRSCVFFSNEADLAALDALTIGREYPTFSSF